MIKKSKKIISIVLALMMVISCFTVLTVNAATTDEVTSSALASVYQTNPNGAKGKNATISIDGSFSDWTADMKIAQSGAWDVANNWKGAHENCVLDTTGLYAAWDNQNLYVAWQMVNITDTFWREGDGPLSDGGRVLDVPLILALSVDPSSPSLNNKVTDGKKIWGVDIEFDTHVDHLFYMSGKVGLGTPAMFVAADSTGTTNYTSACKNYKDTGIKYALAEGNIESSIIGLDGSQSPDDVTSDASNWVDFKTLKGSQSTHNTKYDSFYEMSIPLSALGIDANYLNSNGIGAMIVASRGESGLDCTPYDMCMIDNATGEYSSDPSTSHEKDDADVITSAFARIGGSGSPIVPTVAPTTVAPTQAPIVAPTTPDDEPTNTLDVNVTSNLCNTVSKTYSADEKTVTVTANLESSNRIVDGEIYIKYDPTKLKISASNYDEDENPIITPTITAVGGEIVNMNYAEDTICVTFTNTKKYNFTTSKPLVQVTFDVIGTGSTNVDINVEELDCALSGSNTPVILVKDGAPVDLYNTTCKTTTSLTDPTVEPPTKPQPTVAPTTVAPTTVAPTTVAPTQAPTVAPIVPTVAPTTPDDEPTNTLDVNVTSNLCNTVSKTYSADEKTVTVTANLESSNRIVDGEIYIKYDPTKLKISASNYDEDENPIITPTITAVGGEIVNMNYAEDTICVTFTNTKKYNFTTSKPLVQVTFDVIGTGSTNVDINVEELDCALSGSNTPVILVKDGAPVDLYNTTCKTTTSLTDPTVEPPTKPQPTVAPTTIPDETDPDAPETLNVKATSNLANAVSDVYGTSDTVTVTYNLESSNRIVDGEVYIKYDPSKLKISASNYDEDENPIITPTITAVGGEIVNMAYAEDTICITFTNTKKYNFTTKKPLVTITFDIIGSGDTTVNMDVAELDCVLSGSNLPVILVKDSVPADLYNTTCKSELVLSAPAPLPSDPALGENDINVIAKSNIAPRQTQIYSTLTDKQVKVTYMLQADQKFNAGEWRLTYDPAMLKFASANYDASGNVKVMPVADGKGVTVANLPEAGRLRGTFGHHTNIYDFTTKGKLVEVTFDIVGKGTTTVNLIMDNLGYLNNNNEAIKMVEDSNIAPAYKATGTIELSSATPVDPTAPVTTEPTTVAPTVLPTTQPTTAPPTTEPTQPTDPKPTMLGDVDLDGLVTIKDATLVQEHVAKYRVLTGQAAINADVDFSGDINIIDASNIQMVVSKLMKDFV